MPQEHEENVGPGWRPLLRALDSFFQSTWEGSKNDACLEILQVKEKFGTLRIYLQKEGFSPKENQEIDDQVRLVETLSRLVCEECGRGSTQTRSPNNQRFGWVKTLCEKCHEERDQKYPGILGAANSETANPTPED